MYLKCQKYVSHNIIVGLFVCLCVSVYYSECLPVRMSNIHMNHFFDFEKQIDPWHARMVASYLYPLVQQLSLLTF